MDNFKEDYDYIEKGDSPSDVGFVFLPVILLVILVISLSSDARASVMSCDSTKELSDNQVKVIYESYDRGLQDNLGYTLAAISWRESSLGKYRINPVSGDYGAYAINYKTVQRLDGINYYQAVTVLEKLIFDDDIGAKYAITTLKWNLKHHKGDWRKAVMHYNAGNRYWLGKGYANDVALKVRILRTCFPQ